jgi:hypothetical protein
MYNSNQTAAYAGLSALNCSGVLACLAAAGSMDCVDCALCSGVLHALFFFKVGAITWLQQL